MRVLKLSPKNLQKMAHYLGEEIKKGKVAVVPTDTVYGLTADATNQKAIAKIIKIKKRQSNKPLPVFVKDLKMAKRVALIDKKQTKILKKIWPGKVTAILMRKKNSLLPSTLFAGKKTIGLRIPDYKLINLLLDILNIPLIGTSANLSGGPEPVKIKEILDQFENQKTKPDIVVDAGDLKIKKPSTVVDLTGKEIKIIREGAISKKSLFNIIK
ncbi:threonylcarbamoyl-AMP synthase [bacterium]|nr:threonylcarbamoyl-AMP synthase [bacterium]